MDAARREDLANRMATYAAMVRIMDRNVGRIVDQLSKMNCLENTVLVFLSDNGACAEWDPFGFDNNPYPKNRLYQGDELALMGGPRTFIVTVRDGPTHATHRFAYINTTITKVASSPTIVHWPMGIQRSGAIERIHHVIMVLPFLTWLVFPTQKKPFASSR